MKTQHVLDLIKQENETREWNAQIRMSLREGVSNAVGDLSSYNRSVGREVKQQRRRIEEALFTMRNNRLQEKQRKFQEQRQHELEVRN